MKNKLTIFLMLVFSVAMFGQKYVVWNNSGSGIAILYDDGSHGDLASGDGIHSGELTVESAGTHFWNVQTYSDHPLGAWKPWWPTNGITLSWFTVTAGQTVLFTFDENNVGDGWVPASGVGNVNDNTGNYLLKVGFNVPEPMYDDGDPAHGDNIAGDGIYALKTNIGAGAGDWVWYVYDAANAKNIWGLQGRISGQEPHDITANSIDDIFYFYLNTNTGRTKVQDTPLPVELTTFTAKVDEDDNVLLNWETATEVNNYGFDLELKSSSFEEWSVISFVEGHGNSNSPKYYSYTDKSAKTNSGTYTYRLKQIDIDGTFEYSDVVEVNIGVPTEYKLDQNYPNPFNPTTAISFAIPKQTEVQIVVFDVLGNEITTLLNENLEAGFHSVDFSASELTSGIYFYSIKAGNFNITKKMMLLK